LSAMRVWPCRARFLRVIESRQVSRSSALAPVSAPATGSSDGVAGRCSRSPQNHRE